MKKLGLAITLFMLYGQSYASSDAVFTVQTLEQKYLPKYFEAYYYDVNGDGIKDKLFAHKSPRYNEVAPHFQGDELVIYLAKPNRSQFYFSKQLQTFDEDGGNSFSSIMPRAEGKGFIVQTSFPDRGYYQKDYYIEPTGNGWRVSKLVEKGTVNTESGLSYQCQINNPIKDGYIAVMAGELDDKTLAKKCPSSPKKYRIIANRAIIFNQKFEPTNPPNYYLKNDIISQVVDNTDDWLGISYGKDKLGWVKKSEVVPIR